MHLSDDILNLIFFFSYEKLPAEALRFSVEIKKVTFVDMGCLKLDILEQNYTSLKVAHNSLKESENTCTGTYRFGYQGQFAEDETEDETEETGFHNFELRMWDSKIGRWHTTDPYNQFWSSYVGMGNNPINGVDPDGGAFEKFRARYSAWKNDGFYGQNAKGEWYAGYGDTYEYFGVDKGISFNAGAKIDFNLGAKFRIGQYDVNASIVSFNIVESYYDFNYSMTENDWTYEGTKSSVIGFGEFDENFTYTQKVKAYRDIAKVQGLQINTSGVGYKGSSFGVNMNGQAIHKKGAALGMHINGSKGKGATNYTNTLDFSIGGGAIFTGELFFKINY